MLKTKGLTKIYRSADGATTRALSDVSLEFADRGLVCVLGESGSGKTTLLNMLGAEDRPDAGSVEADGRDLADMSERERDAYRGSRVACAHQRGDLLPHLTVQANAELGLMLAGVPKAERRSAARRALERVGMADMANKKPSMLSGGQYQRVAVARAIAGNAAVVLADEPTGALDARSGDEIMKLLRSIADDRLVIVVTHNETLARRYARRIIRLSEGRVVSDELNETCGSPDARGPELPPVPLTGGGAGVKGALSLARATLAGGKLRTAALAAASGFGLIGLCLVIALTSAFNALAAGVESDLLSTSPVIAGMGSYDVAAMLDAATPDAPDVGELTDETYVTELLSAVYGRVADTSDVTPEYIEYVRSLDESLYTHIEYDRMTDMTAHLFTGVEVRGVTLNASVGYLIGLAGGFSDVAQTVVDSVGYFECLPEDRALVESGYDCVYGSYPDSPDELVFVLDENGCLPDYVMALLGYYSDEEIMGYMGGTDKDVRRYWSFEDLTARDFTFFHNDVVYSLDEVSGLFEVNDVFSASVRPLEVTDPADGIPLRVTGVLRPREGGAYDGLSPGLYYLDSLTDAYVAAADGSAIVQSMRADKADGRLVDPFSGIEVMDGLWKQTYRAVGGEAIAGSVHIYAADVESKAEILAALERWNVEHPDARINYADNVGTIADYVTGIVSDVGVLLFAVTLSAVVAIALLLAVGAWRSVIERKDEISLLRRLGAGKRDIRLMVLAEWAAIGALGGVCGVAISYALLAVAWAVTGLIAPAALPAGYAVLLIVADAALACLAGLAGAAPASRL